jgi:hypothetical protein
MALRRLVLHLGQTRPGGGGGTPAMSVLSDDVAAAHCSVGTDLRLRKVVRRSIPT